MSVLVGSYGIVVSIISAGMLRIVSSSGISVSLDLSRQTHLCSAARGAGIASQHLLAAPSFKHTGNQQLVYN